jgi:hypothetical protein
MVGGTQVHCKVIQREISRVLVLNLSGKKCGALHRLRKLRLDNAFALIEGYPLQSRTPPMRAWDQAFRIPTAGRSRAQASIAMSCQAIAG